MNVVFVLFDSLNRQALECYGGDSVRTPNFKRLSDRAVTFDKHYVGSMPCMPARRDMHTGRLNFLHRSWGPLEPFDESFPQLLHSAGHYSHLVTDHNHYLEVGGFGYPNSFSSFEFVRGQEKDTWKAMVEPPIQRFRSMYHPMQVEENFGGDRRLYNLVNREYMKGEGDFPSVQCFDLALEFLDTNRDADGWFLQLETFDPHEPFHAPERLRAQYLSTYDGPILDYPRYQRLIESDTEVEALRASYAALVALCDEQLGRVLDYFDEHALWDNTALIVTTDHGFLLGEHEWWGKVRMPFYNEIAHIPLMIHHPAYSGRGGQRREALTQTIDMMPTILDMFGLSPPDTVSGRSLLPLLEADGRGHDAVLYGVFGGSVNITDGTHTYFRYPADMRNQELYEYTLMPAHMKTLFGVDELRDASLSPPFDFTKGVSTLRLRSRMMSDPILFKSGIEDCFNALFDLSEDPGQQRPIEDGVTEDRLIAQMKAIMRRHDAPGEAYRRLNV